jgi:hypothetical protein
MKISYKTLLFDSWRNFKKNLVLILPSIIGIAITLGIFVIFGILLFFTGISIGQVENYDSITTGKNIVLFSVFILFAFVAMFLLSAFLRAMEYGLIKDVVSKGKADVNKMFIYGKKYFLKYLLTNLFVVLLLIPSLIIFLLFSFIPVVGIGIGAFFAGVYFIVLLLHLFFLGPIIISKKGSPLEMIKLSFDYSRRNMKHVIVTLCVAILTVLVISLPFVLLESLLGIGDAYIFAFLLSIVVFIRNIVNLILSIVVRVFEFKSYLQKK